MIYHFAIIDGQRRNNTYEAFRRNVLNIFDEPDLAQAMSRELFEIKKGAEETLDDFNSRMKFLVRKFFTKLDLQCR